MPVRKKDIKNCSGLAGGTLSKFRFSELVTFPPVRGQFRRTPRAFRAKMHTGRGFSSRRRPRAPSGGKPLERLLVLGILKPILIEGRF